MLIEASKSCLLIVDMQERLLPVIHEGGAGGRQLHHAD